MDRKQIARVSALLDMPDVMSYVEPCGGSADMLLFRHPAELETFNDKRDDVVVLFRSLREDMDGMLRKLADSERTPRDLRMPRWLPSGRTSETEQARRFYVRSTEPAAGEWNGRKAVMRLVDRLRRVQIECIASLKCVSDFDTPATLFYVRPPPGSSANWSKLMALRLGSIKGKAAVHSDDPGYGSLYTAEKGWTANEVGRDTVWTNYRPMAARTLFGSG